MLVYISKVKKHMIQHNFKNVGPHTWVSLWGLCVAVTVQCIKRNKQTKNKDFSLKRDGGVGGEAVRVLFGLHSFIQHLCAILQQTGSSYHAP